MSTADAILAVRRRSVPLAIGDRVVVGGLALAVVALAALTWASWGDLGSDTGYDLLAGARVADGELPYRDFVYYYGPLAPALAGLMAFVGGTGLAPAIALGMVISVAIVAATYAVARLAAGPVASGLAAAVAATVAFAPDNFSFVLPHSTSATLGLLGALLTVLGIGRYAETGAIGWLWAAGCAAGATALARPEAAVPVWVALAAWLVLAGRAGRLGRRRLVALALPAVGATALVYGVAMALSSPRTLLLDNLLPVDELSAGGREVVRLAAPLTAGSVAELGLRLALYAAGAAALVWLAGLLGRRSRAAWAGGIALAAAGALALLVLALRPETVRYGMEWAYGWIPAGAAIAAVVAARRLRRPPAGAWSPAAQAQLVLAVVLALVAARSYGAFFPYASEPQQAAYAIPLAAILLAWLHDRELARTAWARRAGAVWLAFLALAGASLTVADARDESARVTGPGGSMAEVPERAAVYAAALDAIARNTEPGDPVLVAPQLSALSVLADRPGPLPQLSLLPGALADAAAEREAVRRLDRSGVDLAVVNRRPLTEYGQGAFGETYDLFLRDWLEREFRRTATIGKDNGASLALEIWQRRST